MVRKKGLVNSHISTVQSKGVSNARVGGELATKMDAILGAIQGYKGKTNATTKLMLDM